MRKFIDHNIILENGEMTIAGKELIANHPCMIDARNILNCLFPEDKSHFNLIDLGCLEGGYSVEFAKMGFETLGIEVRQENFECCEYVKKNTKLRNLHFVKDTVLNIKKYGSFDVVFCCGLFYHLEYPREFLRAISSQTRKILILQTHFAPSQLINNNYSLSEITEHEGLGGRWFPEPDVKREISLMASWENNKSFWLLKENIIGQLKENSFDLVLEQFHNPFDYGNLSEYLLGEHNDYLRSTFIGIKN